VRTDLESESDEAWQKVPKDVEISPKAKSELLVEADDIRAQIDRLAKEITAAELKHADTIRDLDRELRVLADQINA
jgi:predicted  nucleic acid-binding Zn-ribbon protein